MMLPQFGFIVAQAGADSHTLANNNSNNNNNNSNNNSTNSLNHTSHRGSSLAPLLNSLHSKPSSNFTLNPLPPTNGSSQVPFYSRQPSPVVVPASANSASSTPKVTKATATSLLPPLLPPPAPYLYNKADPAWYSKPSPSSAPLPPPPIPQQQPIAQHTPVPSSHLSRYSPVQQEEQEYELFDRWQGQYNDLMTWMDNEFWEQADEIYQEKVSNLQEELQSLQKGTHTVYQELMSDIESKREVAILDAESFMDYQMVFIEKYYNRDLQALEEEYQSEKRQIQESLIASLEDRRKQIKEENEQDEGKSSKRKLRKRNNDSITVSATSKDPSSKKRAVRLNTLPNIYTISPDEEEELEQEFSNMKKLITTSLVY
ncbi:Sds3-like-domain-containing protein [Sporodiniella umbellata]|nr:Sds3-like-domain-containing protein [Sporodiniella umbellata]